MSEDSDFLFNLSRNLSEVLSDIGVNERIVQKKRRLTSLGWEVFSNLELLKLDPKCFVYNFGSQTEGSTTDGLNSDIDVLCCIEIYTVIQKWSEWQFGTECTLLMIQDETTYPGYCLLERLRSDAPLPCTEEISGQDRTWFTDKRGRVLLKNTFKNDEDKEMKGAEIKGPAFTTNYSHGDLVLAFHCKFWPAEANPWLEKVGVSKWPSEEMKKSCVESGCLVVPVGSKSAGQNEELEWRISFSQAERCLMFSLNITQMRCYILMKMILKTFINPECKDVITSYMCKNVLFHCIQNTYSNAWNENNLYGCFKLNLKLQKCISEENCPHFIIPGNNLMADRISSSNKQRLTEILETIFKLHLRRVFAFLGIRIDFLGLRLFFKSSQTPDGPLIGLFNAIEHVHICNTCVPGKLYALAKRLQQCYEQLLRDAMDSSYGQDYTKLLRFISILNRDLDKHTEDSMVNVACKLFIPLLSSTLGSVMASSDIYMNRTISPEALDRLTAGFNTDVLSGRLKYASALYCTGDMEETEHFLKSIEDKFDVDTVEPVCGCCASHKRDKLRQGFISISLTGNEELVSQITAFCVSFIQSEKNCVPKESQYEMFRSTGKERAHRYDRKRDYRTAVFWMDWMVVDSLPYLYFLQYKTSKHLHRTEDQQQALTNLGTVIDTERNLSHRETALNLLGQCFEQENRHNDALHCYTRSLNIRPQNNAAKIHICKLLNVLVNKQVAEQ